MLDRRTLIGSACAPLLLARTTAAPSLEELRSDPGGEPDDEDFWRGVAASFAADRSLLNLNNGGVCPSPKSVQEAFRRHLDVANAAPAYTMWRLQQPQQETVRTALARLFGSDREEIAITRNTSESLWICQYGTDLERGDEVLTSDQDYPRMLSAFRQRERREGVKLVKIALPTPANDPAEVVRRFAAAITERTRLILCSHVVNLTGQVLPVKEICALGRERGIPVLVDGAHAFAHLDFQREDLGCDYYATSLHKWLFAPFGTGMLFVAQDRIRDLWPLTAAEENLDDDIRKFEQIGTYPVPLVLSIADAVAFHDALGARRKSRRLVWLRERWASRLDGLERVRFNGSRREGLGCGIANVAIEGVETADLQRYLWREHRIYTISIQHPDCRGLRVSPSVYTTVEEIDRFGDIMEQVGRNGLPA